jgi:hypothetical protein
MPRRVSLPGSDELFRETSVEQSAAEYVQPEAAAEGSQSNGDGLPRSSGRVRHEEKITVYVTADELVDLEHARLELRRSHRISSDRGRIVREAIAIVLADLKLNGEDSVLVDRLRSR